MRVRFAKHLPITSPYMIFTTPRGVLPHISKEETKVQRDEVAFPSPHRIGVNGMRDSASRAFPKH